MNMDISTIYPQDIPLSILFLITAFPQHSRAQVTTLRSPSPTSFSPATAKS